MNTQVSYFKKALVVLMAVMMVFTMMPSMAWAEEDYTPTITKQPQSVAEEKSAGRTSSLTVEATGTETGTLSYQWYEVGTSGDTALTDTSATTKTYEASLKRLGEKSYYCIVTNTVDGKNTL